MDADKLKMICLGMIRLKEAHTAVYIAKVVNDVLDQYGIDISQIFFLTTDNAANMLRTNIELQLLASASSEERSEGQNVPIAEDDRSIDDRLLDVLLDDDVNENDIDRDRFVSIGEYFPSPSGDLERNEYILNAIRETHQSDDDDGEMFLVSIPCVVHTLQLAINEELLKLDTETDIIKKSPSDLCETMYFEIYEYPGSKWTAHGQIRYAMEFLF